MIRIPIADHEPVQADSSALRSFVTEQQNGILSEQVLQTGGVELYPLQRRVLVDGREIVLFEKEFRLLFCLMRHEGICLSRKDLLCEVWGYEGVTRTIDTHIKTLRKKIAPYGGRITTVRGVGYRLDAPEMQPLPNDTP